MPILVILKCQLTVVFINAITWLTVEKTLNFIYFMLIIHRKLVISAQLSLIIYAALRQDLGAAAQW